MSYRMHVLKRKQPFKVENGFFLCISSALCLGPWAVKRHWKETVGHHGFLCAYPEATSFLSWSVCYSWSRWGLSDPCQEQYSPILWHAIPAGTTFTSDDWALFFFPSPNLWKEVVLTVALARFLLSSYVMSLCEEISVTKSEEPTAIGDSMGHWWPNHFNSEPNAPPERPGPVVACFTTINAPKKRKRSSRHVAKVLLRLLFIWWENILMPLN